MNIELVKRLILYIVDEVQDQGGPISKIRLVKFLYLIDYEYFRSHGQTLTSLDWICYKYGPYGFEIDTAIRELGYHLGEEQIETEEGHIATVFKVDEPQPLGDLSFADQMLVKRAFRVWVFEDTKQLLSYVYFETEPMRDAEVGQSLDFSRVERRTAVRESLRLQLPIEKVRAIKQELQTARRTQPKPVSAPPEYDEAYQKAMEVLREEGGPYVQLRGGCSITREALEIIRRQREEE